MQLAMLGLGKMGGNMVQRLLGGGHKVVAYDVDPRRAAELATQGAAPATTLDEVIAALAPPRGCWAMVPAGKITEELVTSLAARMQKGDVIIDGGNSNFKDSQRRAKELAERGIHFVDAGTSGGVWGLKNGYCLMVGGEKEIVDHLEPIFKTLAPPDGFLHVGPVGAGHFVKMIHNGIEYGMLQAYGEGFELLKASRFKLDLGKISHLWNQGSVVRSWLLELAESAFQQDPELASIKGYVEDSGEGRWTVEEAIERNVPASVLTLSLFARFASRQEDSFSAKVIAALRNEFGGHAVKKE